MGVLRLTGFTGMWPVRDIRALPENAAVNAVNAKLDGGAYLKGTPAPALVKSLAAGTKSVYRIPLSANEVLSASFWMEFADINTDVVRAPIVNDLYQRFYWCSPSTGLKYLDKANILSGGASPLDVGVVRPATAVDVEPVAGTGELDPTTGLNVKPKVTRSYVVTYVTVFGEESQPSPPMEATGAPDQNWLITDIALPGSAGSRAAIGKIRLYRTVTGETNLTQFYKVVDLAPSVTFYTDILSDLFVTGQGTIETTLFAPPPDGLQGLVSMPNGIFVSWKDNNLYFTEDYRPHAWPVEYTLTVDHPIVGLGVFGNTCVVCTTGAPAAVTGSTAASMTLTKIDTALPCLSRRSIVSAPEGVYFASDAGLVRFGADGIQIATRELINREQWRTLFVPTTHRSMMLAGIFTSATTGGPAEGFSFVPSDPSALGVINFDIPALTVVNLGVEPWTGRAWFIGDDAKLYEWQPPSGAPMAYTWQSREFRLPHPMNFTVFECLFDTAPGPIHLKMWVTLRGNDGTVLRKLVYDNDVAVSGKVYRFPAGFKGDVVQVEFSGTATIQEFVMASSVAELRNG